MKHVIIGTAGHIDHGKTALIKALTGRNTDRLEEEKKRGITIDLGFTWFDLPDGGRAGIIDVPGHERFIHNMAAGVHGMDMVLLVIAADEGIMPQTTEHIDILTLLGVEHFIIVLNKCDLAEPEWLDMMEQEIREEIRGSVLQDAPLVRVSAADGRGIADLKREIVRMSQRIPAKSRGGSARLPVDRVFSVPGFGTVATGTVLSGRIKKGDNLRLYPEGKTCRVRGIQVYGRQTEICEAGQRAALNLSGIEREEVQRGCVLAPSGTPCSGRNIDVRLSVLSHSDRAVKNQMRLHFYSGTAELLCRAVLLDRESLTPGESGYAQLRMESDTALFPGDRFVVRFYSPLETIGGGIVLETNARREKRFRPEVIERLRQREEGESSDLVELQIRKHGKAMVTPGELEAETGLEAEELEKCIRELKETGRLMVIETKEEIFLWHGEAEAEARKKVLEVMSEYLTRYPYRSGIPAAGFQRILLECGKKPAAEEYMTWMVREGVLDKRGGLFCPAGHRPAEDRAYLAVKEKVLHSAEKAGYRFVAGEEVIPEGVAKERAGEILRLLTEQEIVLEISPGVYCLPGYMEKAKDLIGEILDSAGRITIVQVRDLFKTSRKCARQILDYTDRIGLTKKESAETERVKNR